MFEAEESFTVQLIVGGFVEAGQDIKVFIKSRDGSAIGESTQSHRYSLYLV